VPVSTPGAAMGVCVAAGVAGVVAAFVATVYTPGRAKTAAAVTMRSRRYKDGLPVAVGVGDDAQSAHDQ